MQERYRSDYDGEFIVLNTRYIGGRKIQQREWIPNQIQNNFLSPRAVIIGGGDSRKKFPILRLQNHRGGLLGRKRLQSYGTDGAWKELQCDFCVENNNHSLEQIIEHEYDERVVVYTDAKSCIKYPEHFYLVPYNCVFQTGCATALYLAAFDGHKEIYCLGFDFLDDNSNPITKQINEVADIMRTYSKTEFYIVNNSKNLPNQWRSLKNCQWMNYQTFVTECDV